MVFQDLLHIAIRVRGETEVVIPRKLIELDHH